MDKLHDKTLIMLVAPSAMGKSTLIAEALKLDTDLSRVRSFTTRPRRSDDAPEQFFYLTDAELADKRANGDVVTEITFPDTGSIYGTLRESYQSNYCLLETLAHSVSTYHDLAFGASKVIAVVSPVELWHQHFVERYPTESIDAVSRLREAAASLNWMLDTPDRQWLVNDGDTTTGAAKLISMSRDSSIPDDGAPHARAILELIDKGVWT